MQLNVSPDVADALQAYLNSVGCTACARPLPYDLEASVPLTLVETMSGGSRFDMVLERVPLRITTYAATDVEATHENQLAVAYLLALYGETIGECQITRVAKTNEGYEITDPSHPTLGRAITIIHAWVRVKTIDTD